MELMDDYRTPKRPSRIVDSRLNRCLASGYLLGENESVKATNRQPDAAALEPFDVLIGTWFTEATHPQFDTIVPGSITYEWLEGRNFLVQRSHHDHESFPDSISVIGAPEAGDGLVMEYFDSRGVRRTYRVSLEHGVLRIWRDDPTFAQRFSATLGHDSFEGRWQLARTPGDWQDDLKVTYRRDEVIEPRSGMPPG